MMWVLREAVDLYQTIRRPGRPSITPMTADFSWNKSAGSILEIYGWLTGK